MTMTIRKAPIWPTLMLMVILMPVACMRPAAPSKPVYYYTLAYAPEFAVKPPCPLPLVLRIERFNAAPPFNSQRIIYADKGLHRNAYAYHQWVAAPGELIAFFLSRDLKQSQAFQAVVTPDTALQPTHTITGWVEEFIEEDLAEPARAVASIHLLLIDARQPDPVDRVLFQKRYSANATCGAQTPAALAEAMSTVMAELSSRIVEDIYERLSASPPS